MQIPDVLQTTLQKYDGQRLDGSDRGSGLNAVWLIRRFDRQMTLKIYSLKRGRVQSFLRDITHLLSGRSPYRSSVRCRIETENLRIWRREGFDVPEELSALPQSEVPLPHLCMEYISGTLLSDLLDDALISQEEKEAVFIRFLRTWGARHARAEALAEPRLIHGNGSLEHVLVSGNRIVTFDLELAYTGARCLRALIAAEIAKYLRSLHQRRPSELTQPILDLFVREYPHREYLETVCTELLQNPNPLRRMFYTLDQRFFRRPDKMHKFRTAKILAEALRRHPS